VGVDHLADHLLERRPLGVGFFSIPYFHRASLRADPDQHPVDS
jgi:hypothetical protein